MYSSYQHNQPPQTISINPASRTPNWPKALTKTSQTRLKYLGPSANSTIRMASRTVGSTILWSDRMIIQATTTRLIRRVKVGFRSRSKWSGRWTSWLRQLGGLSHRRKRWGRGARSVMAGICPMLINWIRCMIIARRSSSMPRRIKV